MSSKSSYYLDICSLPVYYELRKHNGSLCARGGVRLMKIIIVTKERAIAYFQSKWRKGI